MISELTKQAIKQIRITSTQPCIAYPPDPSEEIEQSLSRATKNRPGWWTK